MLSYLSLLFFGTLHSNGNSAFIWCEELTHWKGPWCWERLKVAGEGDSRGWDGWMASPTQWTWVWVNSRSWWRTGRPGVLQSRRSQRVDTTTELNGYIFPFLLCLLLLFLSQLSVRPPQTTILSVFISLPSGWSWSLPSVQYHEPPSIVLQALSVRSNPLNLFVTSTVIIVKDLI